MTLVQRWLPFLTVAGLATGCTSIQVSPVGADAQLENVCIQKNDAVWVEDFLEVLQAGFYRHGVPVEVVQGRSVPSHCEFVVTYTARQTWDLTPYLSEAEISIYRNGQQVAVAKYHLKGKGGLSPKKWQGTATKMNPVIDELLREY